MAKRKNKKEDVATQDDFTSDLIIGKASAERLVFLSVMNGLFLFFTATVYKTEKISKYRGKKAFILCKNKSYISSYKNYSKNLLLFYPKVAFLLYYSFYTIV